MRGWALSCGQQGATEGLKAQAKHNQIYVNKTIRELLGKDDN